ncbi:MAG: 5'-nucleotidase [Melioribacteraceae bacterium]|nr:5'-nucleotidase [Melioribacteraceae bacterium]
MSKFNYAFRETKNYVSRPIGELGKSISAQTAIFGDAEFSDLIHNIQLELTNADVSFTAPLSLNAELKQGSIYVRDMFNLYKYENLLYTMELSGKEIKDYLEFSYSLWFNEMENKDDHLLLFEKDDEGNIIWSERSGTPMLKNRYYNFDSAEGIEYTVDLSKPIGERVTIHKFSDGRSFNENEIYEAAINSYRGNGGGNHLTKGAGIPHEQLSERVITSTEKDLRFYLMKWIENEENIEIEKSNNWKVIPQDWHETAAEKDREILFK